MIFKILAFLSARKRTKMEVEIKTLQARVANLKLMAKQRDNQYLVLADDHAALRMAYQKLQYARLEDYRLQRLPKSNRS